MKKVERDKARALRRQGYSMNEIVRTLGIAKSSVSLWTKDIELSAQHRKRLSERGRSIESIERRRQARLRNERARRRPFFEQAVADITEMTQDQLFLIGVALYWGEGSKTKRGTVDFTNSDPQSIQIMMRFFREVCNVPRSKFRGHVILHPHLDAEKAERYWSRISGVPRSQFYKTTMQHNRASKNKKDSLPLGTFAIAVHDTILFLRIIGWMEGVYSHLVPKSKQVPSKIHQFL